MKNIAALFFIVYRIVGSANPTPPNFDKCVVKTIHKVFANNVSLIYVCDGKMKFPVVDENPRIVLDARHRFYVPSTYRNYSQNYVIVAYDLNTLIDTFRAILRSRLWHEKLTPAGKFLLITFEEDIVGKVKTFWYFGMINLVVLVYDFKGVMIDDCFTSTPVQMPKILRKYTNCNATYVTTGSDQTDIKLLGLVNVLLNTVVNKLNVSLRTIDRMNKNYTFDLFTISLLIHKSLANNMHTSTIFSDRMVWIVPFPHRISDLEIMQVTFKNIVWILILVTFVSASLTWWLITKMLTNNSSITEAFLKVYSITLFGSVDKFDLFRSMRCLFLAYVLYSIHIQTAFTSKLIEVLTIPQYEPTIKTITELSDANHTIVILKAYHDYFFEHEEPDNVLYNKIKNKFEVLNYRDYAAEVTDLKTYRNKAVLLSTNELDVLTTVFLKDFFTFQEQTFMSGIQYVLVGNSGSYLIKTIDQLISYLVETGILDHISKNIKYEIHIKREKIDENATKLSLQHLYVVFVFWGVGLSLSTVVIIFELVYKRISNKLLQV
ncbi:hypothetical protein FQR65_LT09874 [Abscondita terminalis]|nr:hypothetical protein FQR65_LT09874 [Abscondita terminalis]